MSYRFKKILSMILAAMGTIVIILSILPIVSYEFTYRRKFQRMLSPVPEGATLTGVANDYKNPEEWFEGDTVQNKDTGFEYRLFVPKLRIEDAIVTVGGEDLSKNLIQYPGTADPGAGGNTVIFGHSVLPYFFNPKDYMTIFSTLPKLDKGDIIRIVANNISYTYEVNRFFEVSPDNLEVLNQDVDGSYVSLVTCVPPGHPLKPRRLVVQAKLLL
ncbi:MAG TPA: sortase [Patescibacteria group bacterium]|nr:sortase [Patescibacteria group bacterium]